MTGTIIEKKKDAWPEWLGLGTVCVLGLIPGLVNGLWTQCRKQPINYSHINASLLLVKNQ